MQMKTKMLKRIITLLTAAVLTAGLAACGDDAKKISEKKYQSILSDMGILGVESAVEGAVYVEAFSSKIDAAYYEPDNLTSPLYLPLAQACGEEKKSEIYGCYVLGGDETAAAAMREAYITYLQSAGYELLEINTIDEAVYVKGSYAVRVPEITGKVSWNDEVTGQYGLYVFYY